MIQKKKMHKTVCEYLHNLYETMEKSQLLMEVINAKAKKQSKKAYDRDKKSDPLQVGDQVLMMTPNGLVAGMGLTKSRS